MRNIARWDLIVSQDSKDLEGALYMQRTCASDRQRVSRSVGRSFFNGRTCHNLSLFKTDVDSVSSLLFGVHTCACTQSGMYSSQI